MSKVTRVPYVQGGKQGIKSPSGNPDRVANNGQGKGATQTKGVFTKAQVTSTKKGGSNSKTGGGKGPSGRS